MNIPGPLSISSANAPHQREFDLRPFQRVTAQVLSVTGTTALLTIEGYPIVAQLASAEQAVTLLAQQTAHFIVTQRTNEKITLKLINDDEPQTNLARLGPQGPELAVRLLEQHNIPITANHLIIARAALKQHLPVTSRLLNDVSEVLSAYGTWNSKEADLATALKAAGLPLSPQSVELASRQAAQIGDSLARLIAKLTDMVGQDLPEEIRKQLDSNLQILNSLVLEVNGEPSKLAEQLKIAAQIVGRSLEHVVREQIQSAKAFPENTLLPMVRLQQSFEQAGKNELAHMMGDFLKDLQQNQFLNIEPDPVSGQGAWSEMGFAIQGTQQNAGEKFSSARLRIAREPDGDSSKINSAYTRLIFQVDLSPDHTVEVDLSIVDSQIKTSVTTSDAVWCQQAQDELPMLEQALQGLGFTLKNVQIEVGKPRPFERLTISSGPPLMTINIEA